MIADGSNNLHRQTTLLRDAIEGWLHFTLPASFESTFNWHARRLPQDLHDDLGSLLALECYDAQRTGHVIDDLELRRILDRIRHRLTRSMAPNPAQSIIANVAAPTTVLPAATQRAAHEFISRLTVQEAFAFSEFVEGATPQKIAHDLCISVATVYRLLARLKTQFGTFVEQLGLSR